MAQLTTPKVARFTSLHLLPDVSIYPELVFDGTNATYWLKGVQRQLSRYEVDDITLIEELPYWTKNEIMEFRVRSVLGDCKDWASAKEAILKTFRIHDVYGIRTPYDKLRDLEKGPMLESAVDIHNYSLNHKARVSKLDEPNNLADREKVRGLYGRIPGRALRQMGIESSKGRKTFEDILELKYEDALDLIEEWTTQEALAMSHATNAFKDDLDVEPGYTRRKNSMDKGVPTTRSVNFITNPNAQKTTPTLIKGRDSDSTIDRLANQLAEMLIQIRTQHNQTLSLIKQQAETLKNQQQSLRYVDRTYHPLTNVGEVEVNTLSQGRYGYGLNAGYGRRYRYGPDRSASHMCYFCQADGHSTRDCEIKNDCYKERFLKYDGIAKVYRVGGKQSSMEVPLSLVLRSKSEKKSIHLVVSNWVLANRDIFSPLLVKKADYYITKDRISKEVEAKA